MPGPSVPLGQGRAGRASRARRSARAWLVDAAYAAAAGLLGLLVLLSAQSAGSPSPALPVPAELAIDAALAAGLLLFRRHWPLATALVAIAVGTISAVALGAIAVALFTVAAECRWPATALAGTLHAASLATFLQFGTTQRQYWESMVTVLLMDAALIASGLLVRSQRLLVRSLRDRARQVEEGQHRRIEAARQQERERIAREMHDVLAHRISLVSVHAGALEFRPKAPADEVARAAGVIRQCAYEALEDLREVIGVLRGGTGTAEAAEAERPQPTMADLADLIGESQRSGTPVTLDTEIADPAAVPAGIGRHAYRIVQEGLTNARKHAPGTHVHVRVAGRRGARLTVEVRNSLLTEGARAPIAGAGVGLVGLRERAQLVGGELEHGRTSDGYFRLWASLPWRA